MGGAAQLSSNEKLEDAVEWSYIECLNKNARSSGLYLSGHRSEEYRPELRGFTTCSLAQSEREEIAQTPEEEKAAGFGNRIVAVCVGGIMRTRSLQSKKDETKLGAGELGISMADIPVSADIWNSTGITSVRTTACLRGKLEHQRDSSAFQIIVEKYF